MYYKEENEATNADVGEKVKNKSLSKRNIIINVAIILIVTALLVFYLTKTQTFTAQSIRQIAWYNYLIVFAYFFLGLILISLVDFFIYRSFTRSMPFGKCLLNTVSGNLGSGITPFRSGHFPLMLYYQNRARVPISDTVTGLIKCQIIYSATSIIVYTAVVSTLAILGVSIEFYGQTVKLWLVVSLGLIFHVLVFGVIVVLAFSRRIQDFTLKLWAKFLVKIKKLKNTEEYINEKSQKLNIYKEQITIIGKNAYKYLLPMFIYVAYMLVSCTVQYLSYLLISGSPFNINTMFTFYTFFLASGYITNIVPVPGGLGTSELLFPLVFASVIPDSIMGAVLILWRVASYYFAIIVDFIIFFFAVLIRAKGKTIQANQTITE